MAKINIIRQFIKGRTLALFTLLTLYLLSLGGSLSAQSVNQGYNSDQPLQKGMLVAAKEGDPTKVEPVTDDTIERLIGVVVQQNDSPVTLSGQGQDVFVATSGIYDALVSDENGEIKKGDYVTISSLAGIAMKVNDEKKMILGRANADFNGKDAVIGSSVDANTKHKVNFGRIQIAVSINRNPLLKDEKGNSIPKVLQRISVSVAGKPVNTARIWMATAVFLGTSLIVGIMLYSGARSSLISVGRNPLSKSVIIRGLVQVVVVGLIVFISGMFGVYLLLKL